LGKLALSVSVEEMVDKNRQDNNILVLPIELAHVSYLKQLPQHHKDPFDRIIIAQAMLEDMAVISADRAFSDYAVKLYW
jgi:PIN domain nuclease of toxin-antitoxin system